jgi:hypothetical protein
MTIQIDRRRFLQVAGWTTGIAVATAQKPARAAPPKKKTLTDRGRGADRLTLPTPAGGGYRPGYRPGYH